MLCRINPTVGGASNEQARAINFLRAIQAICTASAGSTPSALSQTSATASPSGTDVITEVISNTEAGGWANSASTNVTSNYNTSYDRPYQLDLYRDSGKGTYPYRKLSFRTNPYYAFNSSYTTYPLIWVSHGFNTISDASSGYTLGTDYAMPDYGGQTTAITYKRFDVNYFDAETNAMNTHGFRPGAGEWLIASTSQYFIAMSGGLGQTGNPGSVMYVGLRTTNAWETQYDDNPALASFYYDGGYYYDSSAGSNASMWCRTLNGSGGVNSNPSWFRIHNSPYNGYASTPSVFGYSVDPLTGARYYSSYGSNYSDGMSRDARYYYANEMQIPMLGMTGIMRSKARSAQYGTVGPVTDPVTGTYVPPAFPITFARNQQTSSNPGGTAIGLYKSLGGTDSFMQQYYAPGQTFVLNNEGYYPYAIGNDTNYRDLFLVRKA